ncbi:hypothetical protein T4E_12205 [Trichinella pseudospiralis]|uniref:Uncharacterized protein n=1 Tax=Trichinella pseudospiralis TaxID=6337 RepID=A0A0V0XKT8_TRIPS|nr:hypothetical protein T4E_12205 [Trichinella pseudospiralis]
MPQTDNYGELNMQRVDHADAVERRKCHTLLDEAAHHRGCSLKSQLEAELKLQINLQGALICFRCFRVRDYT